MFCRNCGKQMGENQFCPTCGTKAVDNQSAQEQIAAVKATAVNASPVNSAPDKDVASDNGKVTNKKKGLKLAAIIGLPLIVILIIAGVLLFRDKTPSNWCADNVVRDYLDAVNKQDTKLLLKCIDEQKLEEGKDQGRFKKADLKKQLAEANAYFQKKYGENWRAQVEVYPGKEIVENSETKYFVPYTVNNEERSMLIKKVDGLYYLDEYNLDK